MFRLLLAGPAEIGDGTAEGDPVDHVLFPPKPRSAVWSERGEKWGLGIGHEATRYSLSSVRLGGAEDSGENRKP